MYMQLSSHSKKFPFNFYRKRIISPSPARACNDNYMNQYGSEITGRRLITEMYMYMQRQAVKFFGSLLAEWGKLPLKGLLAPPALPLMVLASRASGCFFGHPNP